MLKALWKWATNPTPPRERSVPVPEPVEEPKYMPIKNYGNWTDDWEDLGYFDGR